MSGEELPRYLAADFRIEEYNDAEIQSILSHNNVTFPKNYRPGIQKAFQEFLEQERAKLAKEQKEREKREQKEREKREQKEQKEREQKEREKREQKEQREREQREKEQREEEQREREQREREQREREQREKEQREREQRAREQREREQRERAQREKEQKEQKEREQREREQREKEEQRERERREREQREREQREKEQGEKEARAQREQREREQREKELREKEQREREASAQREQREIEERAQREREQREREHEERNRELTEKSTQKKKIKTIAMMPLSETERKNQERRNRAPELKPSKSIQWRSIVFGLVVILIAIVVGIMVGEKIFQNQVVFCDSNAIQTNQNALAINQAQEISITKTIMKLFECIPCPEGATCSKGLAECPTSMRVSDNFKVCQTSEKFLGQKDRLFRALSNRLSALTGEKLCNGEENFELNEDELKDLAKQGFNELSTADFEVSFTAGLLQIKSQQASQYSIHYDENTGKYSALEPVISIRCQVKIELNKQFKNFLNWLEEHRLVIILSFSAFFFLIITIFRFRASRRRAQLIKEKVELIKRRFKENENNRGGLVMSVKQLKQALMETDPKRIPGIWEDIAKSIRNNPHFIQTNSIINGEVEIVWQYNPPPVLS